VDYLFKPIREEAWLQVIHEALKMTEAPDASDTCRQGADLGEADESCSMRVGRTLLEKYSI
jgi:hypothetical protein